jgi:hypothetical protein
MGIEQGELDEHNPRAPIQPFCGFQRVNQGQEMLRRIGRMQRGQRLRVATARVGVDARGRYGACGTDRRATDDVI